MRVVLGVLLALALVTPAGATSVPIPASTDSLAYGGGHVLWAGVEKGDVVVHQRSLDGGPATELARIPRAQPTAEAGQVILAANAGGYVVALRDGRLVDTGECGCDYLVSRGELVARGGFDGTTADVVRCTPKAGFDEQPPMSLAAGTSGFAVAGVRCPTASAVTLIAAGGTVTPVAQVDRDVYELDYDEPYVAALVVTGDGPRVRLVDTASGAVRVVGTETRDDGISGFAIDGGGTVILSPSADAHSISSRPLDSMQPFTIPGVRLADLGRFAAAGGRVLFAPRGRRPGLGLVGADGSGLTTIGEAGAGAGRSPLSFDGTTAAFTSHSCRGAAQVTVVDVTVPPAGPGCPVSVRQTGRLRFGADRRATIAVNCPNGCTTRVELSLDLEEHRVGRKELNRYVDRVLDSHVAEGRVALAPGTEDHPVTLRLLKPAAALLRRHRHLRVFADVEDLGAELPRPARFTLR